MRRAQIRTQFARSSAVIDPVLTSASARKPACEACTLHAWCEYANGNPKGKK